MPPTISAIIPLYNGAKYIRGALESVFDQTLRPSEIIVVDDGSTDDGPEIVESMRGNHPLTLLRKPNGGQGSARNYGVNHSTGELIAFLDQDDAWYPHHLAELAKPFAGQHYPPLGWVYANLDEVDGDGLLVHRGMLDFLPMDHPKKALARCLSEDMFVLPSASLISRDAFKCAGGFDERLSGYEDDDLFLRLFRLGYQNIYINKPLSKWRIGGTSCSYTHRMQRSRMIYAMKLIQSFPDNDILARRYTRDAIAPRFVRAMFGEYRRALSAGDNSHALKTLDDLSSLRKYSGGRHKLMLAMALPILRRTWFARLLLRLWPIVRRFIPL